MGQIGGPTEKMGKPRTTSLSNKYSWAQCCRISITPSSTAACRPSNCLSTTIVMLRLGRACATGVAGNS